MSQTRNPETECPETDATDATLVQQVWVKATPIAGINPSRWRADRNGNLLSRESYGQQTRCGWVIAYRVPPERGGASDLANLEPLQWEDDYILQQVSRTRAGIITLDE